MNPMPSSTQTAPNETAPNAIELVHRGACPSCGQSDSPVDIRTSHRAMSFLVVTQWSSPATLACRACGYKALVKSSLLTLVIGWWGFPFGLLATPVQLVRNIFEAVKMTNDSAPSKALQQFIEGQLATYLATDPAQAPANPGEVIDVSPEPQLQLQLQKDEPKRFDA